MKDLDQYITRATKNIKEDRAAAATLLMSLMKYMTVSEDRHKEVGLIAAKYLETLQRSNEQLVKLTALLQKKSTQSESMSEEEINDGAEFLSAFRDWSWFWEVPNQAPFWQGSIKIQAGYPESHSPPEV